MRLRSGLLTTKITLQEPTTEQDEFGQPGQGWTDVASVWANLTDISGREFFASNALLNSAQTKITIRYRTGITPSMRVIHKNDIYNIEAVLGQDRLSLLLVCSRGAN